MTKINIVLVFIVLLLNFSKSYSQDPKLIWADEFDSVDGLNKNKWNFEYGDGCPELCGWGNGEQQFYSDTSKNIRIEDGRLILEAHKVNDQWTSARITTEGKFSFTHGRIEFRAKLTKGSGSWPALWLLASNVRKEGWPDCGEIDVMEFAGKNPTSVHGSIHTKASHGATINTAKTEIDNLADAFHTFSIDWTKEAIKYYIDGKEFYSYSPSTKTEDNWPFKSDFFVIINLAMGGNFGSDSKFEKDGLRNGIDPDLEMARFEIDYVRVYNNGQTTIGRASN